MKKIFLSFIILSLFGTIYAQKNIGDFKTINVREKIHNGNYQLIGKGDSSGQFYYRNMQNPERPLDGVNLRTLRSYYNTFFDTIVVYAGDTVIIPAPDTFRIVTIDTSYWLHTGESFTIPAYVDTFYNSYFNNWIGNNDAIYFPPADTSYSMFDKKWKGLNDTIKADSVIYIRPRPGCTGCWDYHNVGSNTWHQWFCTENNKPNLLSTPNTDSLLLIDWYTEFPNQGIVTSGYYLGFVVKPDNFGKVFYTFPDSSVGWVAPDSLLNDTLFFSEFEKKWKLLGDTIEKQVDSINFNGKYYVIGRDSISISDSVRVDTVYSQITRTDTIFSQISRVDTVYSIINRTQFIYNQITHTDTIFSQVSRIDTIYSQILKVDTIYLGGARLKDEKVVIRDRFNLYGSNPGYLDTRYFSLFNTGIGYNTIVPKDTSLWKTDIYGIHPKNLLNNVSLGDTNKYSNCLLYINPGTGKFNIWSENDSIGGSSGGMVSINNSLNGEAIYAKSRSGNAIRGKSTAGYAGYFEGGKGIYADSLKVGSTGSTISRTGTMATYDIWTGTQAEYDAIRTPSTTTLYYIHEGYGWIGLLLLLLLSLGSNSQNWTAVKIGTTDISKIYQGEMIIWEKNIEEDYINLMSPNAGAYLVNGESYDITWETNLTSDSVMIDLYNSNSLIESIKVLNLNSYTYIPDLSEGSNYSIVIRSVDSTITSGTENEYFNVKNWTLELTVTTGYYYDDFLNGNFWGYSNNSVYFGSIYPENTGIQFLQWYDIPDRESRIQLNSTSWNYNNYLIYFKLDDSYYSPLLNTGTITFEFAIPSNPFGSVGSTHSVKILII